jgi:hypothetical protein
MLFVQLLGNPVLWVGRPSVIHSREPESITALLKVSASGLATDWLGFFYLTSRLTMARLAECILQFMFDQPLHGSG